ncbi:MAG: GNAT family N-acetyltransferase [Actinomycetota bacterium]
MTDPLSSLEERRLVGLDFLEAVTTLLQRTRNAHPVKGTYEAADLQWWWRDVRSTDRLEQLFWFDGDGNPEAALIVIDWGDSSSGVYEEMMIAPMTMPDAPPDRVARVIDRGLADAKAVGITEVDLEVDRTDTELRAILFDRGFTVQKDGLVEGWLDGGNRPELSACAPGYLLRSRSETLDRPHHMVNARRKHIDPEPRLRQTSLYHPDLDLVVFDPAGDPAAYGLFWFDPVTGFGMVEPMRTEEDHQRKGLARHILTAGVNRLLDAGATRIKICYEADNPASGRLYRDVGFEPLKENDVFIGPTAVG